MKKIADLTQEREKRAGAIAFIDLKAQQKRIRTNVEKRLCAVLDHGRYIAGPEIQELEELLAEKTGARKVISCASGTDALIIPMLGLGMKRTDAVFLPAFTYNATANAIWLAGATPFFVDIDPHSFTMCPFSLKEKIAAVKQAGKLVPRAILAVDLFGLPADYTKIEEIAKSENMALFADAAQSFGGKQNGKWVGNLAPVTGTSFFPGKALGCYGDGGAIFVRDEAASEVFESIRWHGTDSSRSESIRIGMNGRLDTFQAAIVLEKIEIFYQELAARKHIAEMYHARLQEHVMLQAMPSGRENGFGYFTITTEKRDTIRALMEQAGVPTAVYYRQPLHKMKAFARFAPDDGLPNCEMAATRVLSLPMHPYLTDAQVEFICDVFLAATQEAGE